MTIDPTREEWQAACDALSAKAEPRSLVVSYVEAVLGCPCPPEPAPEPFRIGKTVVVAPSTTRGRVWVVYLGGIAADDADAMGGALIEHAKYARRFTGDDGL